MVLYGIVTEILIGGLSGEVVICDDETENFFCGGELVFG